MKAQPMTKGTYALVLSLVGPRTIEVGKLGSFLFLEGFYVYVGSALSGLEHRLNRHLRRDKALRWHADYLRQIAEVDQVWFTQSEERLECGWMRLVSALPEAQIIVPHFGSSDCQCPAHLAYFASRPDLSILGADSVFSLRDML